MSLNGKTGLVIGLVIVVAILLAFSFGAIFSYININKSNQQLLQYNKILTETNDKLEETVNSGLLNKTQSFNVTDLLSQYEENKVTRSLKSALDAYTDEDNLKDLCSLWGTLKNPTVI